MNIEGGCYCGRVRYATTPDTKFRVNCHCSNCRKAVGAQAVAYIVVNRDAFSFTRGNPKTFRTDTGATRSFCDHCGSSLTYETERRKDDIDIVVGSLDNPDDFPPEMDYYPDEKVAWVNFQTNNIHG